MKPFQILSTLACMTAGLAATSLPCAADILSKPEDFAAVEELPDPFLFLDGSRVASKADWVRRRKEMLELVLTIQYGHLPEAPGNVKLERIIQEKEKTMGHALKTYPHNGSR